jgi:DNA-binding NtrC family response regulator
MEVIQRGAYEFLPKPFDWEELKHHVVHAAEKHHPVELRKRAPAESVKNLNTSSKSRPSAAGA